MNKTKVVRAEVFLEFAENMEQTLEILSLQRFELMPRGDRVSERTLKQLRKDIEDFRKKLT